MASWLWTNRLHFAIMICLIWTLICVTFSNYSASWKLFRNTDFSSRLIIKVISVKKMRVETNNGQSNQRNIWAVFFSAATTLLLCFFRWCYLAAICCLPISAVSRAILKLVYQFGMPNSDTQTLKSVKINSSKNRQMTIHALIPQCDLSVLSYSEC